MKKVWRVILVIVVICVAVGAVSAGVGVLTGADFARIGSVFQERIAEQYNVDLNAFIHEWIPEAADVLTEPLR